MARKWPDERKFFSHFASFLSFLLDCMYMLEYTYDMSKTEVAPEQQAFLDELAGLWPLAKGSLAEVRKPCIRPHCPACRRGKKHPAVMFSFTHAGKRRCRYIPAELAPLLRQALANGRRLEQRLAELGQELLERYRQQRG
mgnify:CR=1 FL=1